MPAGFFTEPVRAWRTMEFTSQLCPANPLPANKPATPAKAKEPKA
jgi:hypothetical protein